MSIVAIGRALGLGVAAATTRLEKTFLYDVTAIDPILALRRSRFS